MIWRNLRNLLKYCYFEFLLRSGATTWARLSMAKRGEAVVLTLHRVLSDQEMLTTNSPAGMILRGDTFKSMVTFLSRHADLIASSKLPCQTNRLAVALTFDDGWWDNYRLCTQQLYSLGIPASIFICPGLVGTTEPFWPERALAVLRMMTHNLESVCAFEALLSEHSLHFRNLTESTWISGLKDLEPAVRNDLLNQLLRTFSPPPTEVDRTMTWPQLQHLVSLGFEIGSHTSHHEILPFLSSRDQLYELTSAPTCIQNELGVAATSFSYPNGSWDDQSRTNVTAAAYKTAFINQPGVWSTKTDPYLIPRVNISDSTFMGWNGRFSEASAHYSLFWLPYLHRRRSRLPEQLLSTAQTIGA
jgi:peptidoglycan/xylan/chitin deacetylase (PgdA/CDA1 family)